MTHVVITWWTGLLAMGAIALFAVWFILRLRECGIRPLRYLAGMRSLPMLERVLLVFFVCGMVRYAATKGTGNGSRVRGYVDGITILGTTETSEDLDGAAESNHVTNLHFTRIAVLTNGVVLSLAWPTNLFAFGTTLDFFAKHRTLTNAWQWFACQATSPGTTNVTLLAEWQGDLGCVTNPPAMFFKVQDRATCAVTMADADCDGLPDIYELHNGTNPYVSDYALAPKLTVGEGGDFGTLTAALSASTNYSIVELSADSEVLNRTITMPPHPVLITGPQDGYARIYNSADIAMFLLDQGQGSDTLFRNLYVVLTARRNFQAAFWIGGNLPWSGIGASPTFENVRVRALYPDVLHYGWHYYRDNGGRSAISNCAMNAAGSTSTVGVYAYDGPDVVLSGNAFVNFPTNANSYTSWVKKGTNVVTVLPQIDTNLSWAGYALDGTYGDAVDSDGDGISDNDEIRVSDTDPWLPDSDGDGLTDGEEIDTGTDPRDLHSFYRRITIVTTVTDCLSGTTNYVAWGLSATGWETNDLAYCWTFPATNACDVMSQSGSIYVKSFQDLNRNGRYDVESDIILIRQIPTLEAVSTFVLAFGDVDDDGVSDADERRDGSDPYDAGSFRLRTTVKGANADIACGITNYLGVSGCLENDHVAFVTSGTLAVDMLLTNGLCEVICLRDFNGNGAYDADTDVIFSKTLTKSDNGNTASIAIGDADSDGQADSIERAHGTNPTDAKSYCFNLAFVEKGVFSTTNALTAEILFGTNVVAGPTIMTNRTWEVDVGHLVASNRETAVACFWDDANSNGVCDVEECFVRQTFTLHGHDNVLTNTLALGTFDHDNDDMLDYWELMHAEAGLSPTNAADAFLDPDADGLINLHEYWTHCEPFIPDGSNTLLSVMARSVDDRLVGKDPNETSEKFLNYVNNGTNFVLNSFFWANDVDTSCVSMWNDATSDLWGGSCSQWHKAGTAISKRHIMTAWHYAIPIGTIVWFMGNDGIAYSRVITGLRAIGGDICIQLLDRDLPDTVEPVKILPKDYYDYIKNALRIPVVTFNQMEKLTVSDSAGLVEYAERYAPTGAFCPCGLTRLSFYEDVISGDSGNPRFFIKVDRLILLSVIHYGGTGSGCFVTHFKTEIQRAMDELLPGYHLEEENLNGYEKLDQ